MEYLDGLKAYAKINLTLNVLGNRPDGYHEIETLMQAIALHDEVNLAWEETEGSELEIELDPGRPDLPDDEENLAWQAAQKMHDKYHAGLGERIEIEIIKIIPFSAGLGGGSADAAAVITGLAKLWGIEIGEIGSELYSLAAEIGSDVPFCLASQNGFPACIGKGKGEILTAVKPFNCQVLLVTPGVRMSTADVYKELKPEDCSVGVHSEAFGHMQKMVFVSQYMNNHLQAPAMRICPEIKNVFDWFRTQKAFAVQMTGSGPTVFGVYPANRTTKIIWGKDTPSDYEIHMVPSILSEWNIDEDEESTPLPGMKDLKNLI